LASARFESAETQNTNPVNNAHTNTTIIRTFGRLALKLVPIIPVVTHIVIRSTSLIVARVRPIIDALLGTTHFRDEVLWVCLELGLGVGFILGVALSEANTPTLSTAI
jgi:hypothetical protein